MDGLTGRIASTDLLVVRGAVSSSISKPTRLLSSITELRSRRGSGPALAYSLYSPNCVEGEFSEVPPPEVAALYTKIGLLADAPNTECLLPWRIIRAVFLPILPGGPFLLHSQGRVRLRRQPLIPVGRIVAASPGLVVQDSTEVRRYGVLRACAD